MFKLIIGDMRLIYEPPTAENHGYVNGTYVATDCGGVGCGYFAKTSKYGTMEISYIGMKGTANIPFFRLLMHEFSHMINYRWTVDGTTAPETYYNKLGPTGTEFESGEDGFMEGIHNMRSGDWAYEWVTDAIAFWFMGLFESDVSGVIREKQIQDMMARILWTAIQP
jgi:hypothetical protein